MLPWFSEMSDNSDHPNADLSLILWLVCPDPFRTLGGVKQLSAPSQNSVALSKIKLLSSAGKGWYQRQCSPPQWSPSIYVTRNECIVCVCKEELMKVSSVVEDRLL